MITGTEKENAETAMEAAESGNVMYNMHSPTNHPIYQQNYIIIKSIVGQYTILILQEKSPCHK
jgi:hypothetical protein